MGKKFGPSIKDDAKYEALRRQGASKEKAARIANAPGAGKRGGKAPPYEEWSKDSLYRRAQELEIAGRSSMSKPQLIRALRVR